MRGHNSLNLGSLSGTVFQDPGFGDVATDPGPKLTALTPTLATATPAAAAPAIGIGGMLLIGAGLFYVMSKTGKRR